VSAPFKAGDRAYCVNAHCAGSALSHGTLYFVAHVKTAYDGLQYLFLLGGSSGEGWDACRFRRVDAQDKLWPMRGTFDKWGDSDSP
jgi:hypothetical protein